MREIAREAEIVLDNVLIGVSHRRLLPWESTERGRRRSRREGPEGSNVAAKMRRRPEDDRVKS